MEANERTPIFTNTYLPNERTDRQMFGSITRARRLITLLVCTAVFAYLLYELIDMIRWATQTGGSFFSEAYAWVLMAGIAVYAVIFVLLAVSPRMQASKQAKRMREMYGEKRIGIRSDFFDDAIVFFNTASNARVRLQYSVFRKITETGDLILLWSGQKQIIALGKDGFTGIDVPGFRTFMDEKCPNAKRRWRKDA